MPKTLFDKIWDNHIVHETDERPTLLYVDLHLIHEVTSPQAFEGLKIRNRKVRRPDLSIAVTDHNVPTKNRHLSNKDKIATKQINRLLENAKSFDITVYDLNHKNNGIVHVIGPELGLTTPGKIIVCGDSHTSTHGAFGSFGFGIGTSEIEHVLATQTITQKKPKTMKIELDGELSPYVTSKDIILGVIGEIGTAGGTGHVIEFTGKAVEQMSMEQRMTMCNMSIEAGAKAGLIAPDNRTIEYLKNKPYSPKGIEWEQAIAEWEQLKSDENATYDRTYYFDVTDFEPFVTYGTSPEMVTSISGRIPNPSTFQNENQRESIENALGYMNLKPGTKMSEIKIDKVFVGSCTNSRIEDIRMVADIIKKTGSKVKDNVTALVVPGSTRVKQQAEKEGLDTILIEAGFEWREAGCSMCIGLNEDMLMPGERCASTSNRNFEGRQGRGGRTHLVSPPMAAAAAITGHFVDIRKL